MTLKIAIIGKLPSKFQAPYDDSSYQIWGCNVHEDMYKIPRYDLWFDIHNKPSRYNNIPEEKLFLRKDFNFDKAKKLLGGDYLNNSMSIMVMEAIMREADEIRLYGCRLDSDSEIRTKQLENLRELLFFAKGKGIKVYSYENNVLREYERYGE